MNAPPGPDRQLSSEEFSLLRKIAIRYEREALKCKSVRAYYAACIMLGAALEAILIQMCDLFQDEVKEAIARLEKKPKGRFDRWGLDDLIKVAVEAGWLPPKRGSKSDEPGVGELIHLVRRLRDLSHPGRHLRELDEAPIRADAFRASYGVYDAARDWLWMKLKHPARLEPNRSPLGPPSRVVVKPRRSRRIARKAISRTNPTKFN